MVPLDNRLKLMSHLVLPKYIHLKTEERYIDVLVTQEVNIKPITFIIETGMENKTPSTAMTQEWLLQYKIVLETTF